MTNFGHTMSIFRQVTCNLETLKWLKVHIILYTLGSSHEIPWLTVVRLTDVIWNWDFPVLVWHKLAPRQISYSFQPFFCIFKSLQPYTIHCFVKIGVFLSPAVIGFMINAFFHYELFPWLVFFPLCFGVFYVLLYVFFFTLLFGHTQRRLAGFLSRSYFIVRLSSAPIASFCWWSSLFFHQTRRKTYLSFFINLFLST